MPNSTLKSPSRTFEDFELQPLDRSQVQGESAKKGLLYLAKKRVKPGDDPNKKKYQELHFLKKIYLPIGVDPKGYLSVAKREVQAQEFLRLLFPTQPKGRLIISQTTGDIYIQSKAIPGFMALNKVSEAERESLFSPTNYGTEQGAKGLGGLFFLSALVLQDSDFKEHNLGIAGQQLYKIDQGRVFEGTDCSPMISQLVNNLYEHRSYKREEYRACLRFILLSDSLLQAFDANFENEKSSKIVHFAKMRNDIRQDPNKFMQPDGAFQQYLLSDQAKQDLEEYLVYLNKFRLQKHDYLLEACPSALEEMQLQFLELRQHHLKKPGPLPYFPLAIEERQKKEKISTLKAACANYHDYLSKQLEPYTQTYSWLNEEALKNVLDRCWSIANSDNEAVLKILHKRECVKELSASLEKQGSSTERLDNFLNLFKQHRPKLEERRDSGWMIFLKVVATVFTLGLACLFGLWNVKGREVTQEMETILDNPGPKPNLIT